VDVARRPDLFRALPRVCGSQQIHVIADKARAMAKLC